MCIIIEKTNTTTISKAWFDEFWLCNPDGFGIVEHDESKPHGDRLTVKKTLDNAEAWKMVQSANDRKADAIVHFRQATHGEVSLNMCHPFTIETRAGVLAVTHNGMLTDYPTPTDKTHSDTYAFVYLMLAPMIERMDAEAIAPFIRSEGFALLIESYLGNHNRLVISDQQGHVTYNDNIWHTHSSGSLAGIRLSNTYAWSDIEKPVGMNKWDTAKYNSGRTWYGSDYDDYDFDADIGTKSGPLYSPQSYDFKKTPAPSWEIEQDEQDIEKAAQAEMWNFLDEYKGKTIDEIREYTYTDHEQAALVLYGVLN